MGKKMVVIDGDPKVHFYINKNITTMYQGSITIYHAKTFSTLESLIQNNDDINTVVWGAFINDTGCGTMHLLKQLRKDYKGKIIGLSQDRDHQTKLVKFGCNFACTLLAVPYNIARSFK